MPQDGYDQGYVGTRVDPNDDSVYTMPVPEGGYGKPQDPPEIGLTVTASSGGAVVSESSTTTSAVPSEPDGFEESPSNGGESEEGLD